MHYDWGDLHALHDFCGTPADGEPLAEIWYGTHRGGPSRLEDGTLLEDVVAPRGKGAHVDGFPYLAKLIAPAKPLSIQVHPSIEEAEAGFDRENKLGIPLNSPDRVFVDRNHKPEMLLALTPWRTLVGFAPEQELIRFNEEVSTPLSLHIAKLIREQGLERPAASALRDGLKPPIEHVEEYARRCGELARHSDPAIAKRAGMLEFVHSFFPGQSSLLVAALMNIVDLEPGQALFTPSGTIHSYLSGVGFEVMSSSANTIRAGLTSKHVDVECLLSTANLRSSTPTLVEPVEHSECGGSVLTYQPDVEDFRLDVSDASERGLRGAASADTVIVAIDGNGFVDQQPFARGNAMWIPANGEFELRGTVKVAVVSIAKAPVKWSFIPSCATATA